MKQDRVLTAILHHRFRGPRRERWRDVELGTRESELRQRFSPAIVRSMERRGILLFDAPRPEFVATPHRTCKQCGTTFPSAEEAPLCPRCHSLRLPD